MKKGWNKFKADFKRENLTEQDFGTGGFNRAHRSSFVHTESRIKTDWQEGQSNPWRTTFTLIPCLSPLSFSNPHTYPSDCMDFFSAVIFPSCFYFPWNRHGSSYFNFSSNSQYIFPDKFLIWSSILSLLVPCSTDTSENRDVRRKSRRLVDGFLKPQYREPGA